MEKTGKNWKRQKLSYMEFFYGYNYKLWKSMDLHDDRRLYCNTYELVVESIKSLDDSPLIFVCVAMDKHIEENTIIMDKIIANFE